jgi:hypothetical protein
MLGVLLDRMVILPLCWLGVVILNCSTIRYLRRDPLHFHGAGRSIKRLQVRLVLIITIFALLWTLQSIALYFGTRTFALEFAIKWAFGVGFVDALIYGWPTSLTYICGPCCLPLFKRLSRSISTGFGRGRPQEVQQQEGQGAGSARSQGRVGWRGSTSVWETLAPSQTACSEGYEFRPLYQSGSAAPSSRAAFKASRAQPHARRGLTPYHILATTFDFNRRDLPTGGPLGYSSHNASGTGGIATRAP